MYWLPDSGTTAHMTPYASDLDPGSFVSFRTTIRVANGHKATVHGKGSVTLTIRDYFTDAIFTFTLYNVYIVPTLTKRLISTDALTQLNHTITFARLFTTFNILVENQETGEWSRLLP